MCGLRGDWRQSCQLFVSDSGKRAVNDGGGRIYINIHVKHTPPYRYRNRLSMINTMQPGCCYDLNVTRG